MLEGLWEESTTIEAVVIVVVVVAVVGVATTSTDDSSFSSCLSFCSFRLVLFRFLQVTPKQQKTSFRFENFGYLIGRGSERQIKFQNVDRPKISERRNGLFS